MKGRINASAPSCVSHAGAMSGAACKLAVLTVD
jgi:hypothetical protein